MPFQKFKSCDGLPPEPEGPEGSKEVGAQVRAEIVSKSGLSG